MTKRRGRPPLKRSADERILQSGLTAGQKKWLNKNFKAHGFESAAHMLRFIVNQAIAHSEQQTSGPTATSDEDHSFEKMIQEFHEQ